MHSCTQVHTQHTHKHKQLQMFTNIFY